MADLSKHSAKAAAKLKEIAAERESNETLLQGLAQSEAKLADLRSEMSMIETEAADAGFAVADLHAAAVAHEPAKDAAPAADPHPASHAPAKKAPVPRVKRKKA